MSSIDKEKSTNRGKKNTDLSIKNVTQEDTSNVKSESDNANDANDVVEEDGFKLQKTRHRKEKKSQSKDDSKTKPRAGKGRIENNSNSKDKKSRQISNDSKPNREGDENKIEDDNAINEDDLPESINDFEDMEFLQIDLFKGIHEYGFKYPSPIQSRTIHLINRGCDLIAQSQSGTGKTGAFTIGSLSRIDIDKRYPQVIMIANTRTLACQILKVVEHISSYMNIKICLCVGGNKTNSYTNMQEAKHAHVLVGTPGRLGDLISKKAFNGNNIKTLIMDESDVLLKDDFRDQIISIISHMGKKTQICIFSATFTQDTLEMTENFLNNPYRITVEKEKVSLERVKQYLMITPY